MVIKFILLSMFCFNINGEVKCGEYMRNNLTDATECLSMANAIGRAQKQKMEEQQEKERLEKQNYIDNLHFKNYERINNIMLQ